MPANQLPSSEDLDFKYVLQDATTLYIGARFTYQELMENDNATFKLKTVISHYILKDTPPDVSIEQHFYTLTPAQSAYETYLQLKVRVKVLEKVEKKSLFGKPKQVYREKTYPLADFAALDPAWKERTELMVREIIISKLALMAFSV